MQPAEIRKWRNLALLSFLIVAIIGLLMRYKIAYSFPWLSQKFLQHGHSHFAFSAWITQNLFVFQCAILNRSTNKYSDSSRRRSLLLLLHIILSAGILISFLWSGYSTNSIILSSLVLALQIIIISDIWKLHQKYPNNGSPWFKASAIFFGLSTLGTASLSWMMANHQFNLNVYLSSLYWYLHFQYNGWFLFALMGTLAIKFPQHNLRIPFLLLSASCIPAFGLSILWMPMHIVLFSVIAICAFMQSLGWLLFIKTILPAIRKSKNNVLGKWILGISLTAFSAKFILQLISVHPEISHLAFGFRPVVIAYLHLVLLMGVSTLLLYFMTEFGWLHSKGRIILAGVVLLILINQILLGIQAIGSFMQLALPNLQALLVWVAAMLVGALTYLLKINYAYFPQDENVNEAHDCNHK
jgi:hypothetical protein